MAYICNPVGEQSAVGSWQLAICRLPTEVRDVAQPGSALAWGARGRKFESCRPDYFYLIKKPAPIAGFLIWIGCLSFS
jgi:hypothetical protein